MRIHPVVLLTVATVLLCAAFPSFASDAGTGLEWEGPLTRIVDSFTGPVAYAISFTAIVVAGAMLVWGGEINEFARRTIVLVLVISLIMFAGNTLRTLFGSGAATITPPVAVAEPLRHE